MLDSIEAPAVALDDSGRIVAVNAAWTAVAAHGDAGAPSTGVGVSYLTVCDQAEGAFAESAAEAAAGIRSVLDGCADRFALDYPCPSHGVERWFTLRVTPMGELRRGAVVTHLDITDLRRAEQRLHRDEAHLHRPYDETSPIFALVEPDGTIRELSELTTSLLGLRPGEDIGAGAFDRIDPSDREAAMAVFARVLTVPGATERVVLSAIDGSGRARTLDLTVVNLLDDPTVGAVAVSGCDVTEGRLHQIARRLESRLLQTLPAAVVVTDDRGVVVYWNDRAEDLYGYSAAEAIGRPGLDLNVGPSEREQVKAMVATVLADSRWEGAYDARHRDGSRVPIQVTLERVDDDEIDFHGIVGASIDVSDRRVLEDDLAFQALHDPLTGLPNRRLFVDHLERALDEGERTGLRTAVLFIDLDDFKLVNDRVGHSAGDEVLRVVGELVSGALCSGDLVARLGGDEFVVCCGDIADPAEVDALTDRILDVLATPFRVGGDSFAVSASIGVALSGPSTGAEGLLRNADAAMYAAKESGKARGELFDDALRDKVRARRQLAVELEAALATGQIQTHFQPQFALDTGALVGFEALARWSHPERGMVPPDEFIPVAEESGLIAQLGRIVLTESCRALASWRAAVPDVPLTVAVNVSAHQLSDPDFLDTVLTELVEVGVPPALLCLEVTESSLADADTAVRALSRLKAIGVELAIDDFGTGYSSLSRLRLFPVDYLKIDRGFVAGMTQRPDDAVIVAAVLGLARTLGVRTVAEGIDDPRQLAELAGLGCDIGQGFFWSRAVPADDALRLALDASAS